MTEHRDWYADVVQQMKEIFKQEVPDSPIELDEKTRQLRFNLCWEEFKEMMVGLGYAWNPYYNSTADKIETNTGNWMKIFTIPGDGKAVQDPISLLDGAMDLIVVVLGTLAAAGIDPHTAWNEVHRTNMEKANGPVREDGKRLKPEGWQPPNIKQCLIDQGWNPEV